MKFRHIFVSLLAAAGVYTAYQANRPPYHVEIDASRIPTFSQVRLDFEHEYDEERSLPFLGSAVIDIDNDGMPEVFLGGGHGQPDGLFKYRDAEFVNIADDLSLRKENTEASYGAASVDVNSDGYTDLFVARDSGVYLYLNRDGALVGGRLSLELDPNAAPIAVSTGDINRDGHVDLFISCFLKPQHLRPRVFNDPHYGTQSLLLVNSGANTFADITALAGSAYTGNTSAALFADLDNDGLQDLVTAEYTGHIRIYKNLDGNRFKNMQSPLSGYHGYPMGIATGDVNNDDRLDLFFTNSGTTVPRLLARGDLRENQRLHTQWMLLRNDGSFRFTDVAEEYLLAGYELARGAVFADFNLDGLEDLVVAANDIRFPPQRLYRNSGKLLLQKDNGTFAPVERIARVENRRFGISPLVADFNNDGYPDLVHVNLDGPAVARINHGGNANFIKVDLGDSPLALGARVSLLTETGDRHSKQQLSGQGAAADQAHVVTFGLGHRGATGIEVKYPSGRTVTVDAPRLNTTVDLREELPRKTPATVELPVPLRETDRHTDVETTPPSSGIDHPRVMPEVVPAPDTAASPPIEDELLQLLND
ncbi:MAG TPA: CRTAC1 family protein [Gammaproteobacteria bacterium]